jgi:hypothetical protein
MSSEVREHHHVRYVHPSGCFSHRCTLVDSRAQPLVVQPPRLIAKKCGVRWCTGQAELRPHCINEDVELLDSHPLAVEKSLNTALRISTPGRADHGLHMLSRCVVRRIPWRFELRRVLTGEPHEVARQSLGFVDDPFQLGNVQMGNVRAVREGLSNLAELVSYKRQQWTPCGDPGKNGQELAARFSVLVLDNLHDVHCRRSHLEVRGSQAPLNGFEVVDPPEVLQRIGIEYDEAGHVTH